MAAETDTISFHPWINQFLSTINRIFETEREKQVFLRDLIQNSSDSLDKIRMHRLKHKSKLDGELFIRIVPNKASKTLTIIDNGAGFTKSKLVKLGTVLRPDTMAPMMLLLCDANMHEVLWPIPGLGIYAAYLVAERVVMTSKRNGEQYVWETRAGCDSFSVTRDTTGENLGRGTKVTLYLKDDQVQYLDEMLLKDLVKKHSKFINYRISLQTTENDPSRSSELSVIHKKPIWTRKPEDISKEEYAAYHMILMNGVEEAPLAVKHFSHTACFLKDKKNSVFVEFKSILFVPRGKSRRDHVDLVSVSLYQELIPKYLSFVSGIVDSEDVPLKISREIFYINKIHEVIRENLISKCFELFSEIAENQEDYAKFYEAFSNNLKLGMCQDSLNRTQIAELLRYRSTESGDKLISLKDYVSRMKEGQSVIYYTVLLSWWSKTAVKRSPVLEDLKEKGYEVLFMVDAIDQDVVDQLEEFEFEGKKLQEVRLIIGPIDFKDTLIEKEKKHYERWLEGGPEITTRESNSFDDGDPYNRVDWSTSFPRMNDRYDEHEASSSHKTRSDDFDDNIEDELEVLTMQFLHDCQCKRKQRLEGRIF